MVIRFLELFKAIHILEQIKIKNKINQDYFYTQFTLASSIAIVK